MSIDRWFSPGTIPPSFPFFHQPNMATPSFACQSARRPVVLEESPLFFAFDSNGITFWVCRHCQCIPYEWTTLQPPPSRLVDMHLISCDGLNIDEKTSSIPKQNCADITTCATAVYSLQILWRYEMLLVICCWYVPRRTQGWNP